jgi:transcriptional regulator with XRE-family HTH domain
LLLLEQREARARARVATGRAGTQRTAHQSVQRVVHERRDVEGRLRQLEKTVVSKRRQLQRLRQQALRLDKGLVQLREGLQAPVGQAVVLTAEQLRGARAMLGLSQQALAGLLGIGVTNLRRLEKQSGPLQTTPQLLKQALKILRERGVELVPAGLYVGTGGPGLRLKGRASKAEKNKTPRRTASARRTRSRRKQVA